MDHQKPGLLSRVANLIPGYRGYAEREDRRAADQAVRSEVVEGLDTMRSALDRIIADCSRSMQFAELEPLESLKRRLSTLADGVRHAPAGYSAFFDRHEVGATKLEAILGRDLELAESVGALTSRISTFESASQAPAAREALMAELPGLEESLGNRDRLIQGI